MNKVTPQKYAGRTTIADAVVAKIAGLAARNVSGIYRFGGGTARAFGVIRDAVGSTDHAQGIRVEVGETEVAVDIDLVAEFGVKLHEVADQVRFEVFHAVQNQTGLRVIEVNVEVGDVHVPSQDLTKNKTKRA